MNIFLSKIIDVDHSECIEVSCEKLSKLSVDKDILKIIDNHFIDRTYTSMYKEVNGKKYVVFKVVIELGATGEKCEQVLVAGKNITLDDAKEIFNFKDLKQVNLNIKISSDNVSKYHYWYRDNRYIIGKNDALVEDLIK